MPSKKYHQLSIPQIVILLDVLFVFLFILIIKETPPKTEIILPKNILEKGGFLSHEYEKGKFIWYDPIFQMWSGAETDNFSNIYTNVGKYTLQIDCDPECIKTLKLNYDLQGLENNISVVITNQLYDKIARLTFIACQTDKKYCGDIVFPINEQWEIEKNELLKLNPFLKNIPGMVKNF